MKLRPPPTPPPLSPEDEYQLFLDVLHIDLAAFIEAFWPTVNPQAKLQMNWHIHAIAHALQRCAEGQCKRLIINMPPRHGKSFCASVAFIAWLLGRDPAAKVISIAYGEELALDYARGCKTILNSALYKEAFPATRINSSRSRDGDFETTARGMRIATTVGGSITGRGGSYLVIDDPMKAADGDSDVVRTKLNDWYDNTLISRLDQPMEDVVILVMQRVHADDIAGRLIKRGGFDVLNLAAIAQKDERIPIGEGELHHRNAGEALHPERLSLAYLEDLRSANKPVFDAQYQQDPSSPGDAPFQWDDIVRYRGIARREPEDFYVHSWDTAAKTGNANDFSAGAVIQVQFSHMAPGSGRSMLNARFLLVELFRAKVGYEALVEAMARLQRRYPPAYVLIEQTHMEDAIRTGLRSYGVKEPTFIRPEGDKRSRLWAQSHWILQGNLRLPEDAPWMPALEQEFVGFPGGPHDDQVDAISQFLTWATKRVGRQLIVRSY